MTDPNKGKEKSKEYEKQFGLDMPFDEAISRFAHVTKEEIAAQPPAPSDVVPEGEFSAVLFKDVEIRKILHNDEWWFVIPDVIAALTGNLRPGKYWTDLKYKL